jgi:hypothetical protein
MSVIALIRGLAAPEFVARALGMWPQFYARQCLQRAANDPPKGAR